MGKKINFSKETTTFPFAFNPENPSARKATWLNDKTLVITFNMTGDNCPECAAVALILDKVNLIKPVKVAIKLTSQDVNQSPIINLELKKGDNKLKYFESQLLEGKNTKVTISPETCELVFTCWKVQNKGLKGEVCIFFN